MPLSELEEKIAREVTERGDRMLRDLAQLVAIPTGRAAHAGLEAARAWMSSRLTALGATMTRHPGAPRPQWLREPTVDGADAGDLIVANRLGTRRGVRILLSGHLDTVHDPAGTFQILSEEVDGIRRGPGCADMKGGLIVALTALEALHAQGVAVRWSFALNADEETGSFSSADHLQTLATQHDIGLVLEPAAAEGKFVTARAGSAQFRIDAFGRAAHAGRDAAGGISAVGALAAAITDVLALSDPSSGRTVNIGPLQGGAATNIVPDHAVAWGNARYQSVEQQGMIDRALASLNTRDPTLLPRLTVQITHNRPRKPETCEVAAIAAVALAVAAEFGVAAGTTSTGGVSDANVLQAAGLACLDGLGVCGGNLHRADEFIVTASLVERARILAIVMSRLASQPSVP